MSREKRRVPKLRFPGFTEDWEQRKLEDLVDVLDGDRGKNYPKEVDFDVQGHTLFLNASNVTNEGFSFKTNQYITEEKSNSMGNGRLFEDDVIITSRGSLGHIAWYNQMTQCVMPHVRINSGMLILRKRVDISMSYLQQFLRSYKGQSQISFISFGSAQPQLTKKDVQKINITYPANLKEQIKIETYFSALDNLITLYQRKLDNLKLKKKALLQKLFPKNGERYPELRFPGFTDAWEQRKFSDLYEKISEKNDLSYSLDKIISVANMYYKSDAKVSNEEYLKTYNIFRYGEIAFEGNKSKDFAYGRFVENTIGDGIISHVFEVFRPIVKYDIYFWKYYINYEPIMGKVLSRCTKKTTMMTNLVAKDFLKETVLVPTLAEQKQIGTLLNTLDKFITLHQRKLDHLKLQKKALLQQMFV